jgi:hypothetical protein
MEQHNTHSRLCQICTLLSENTQSLVLALARGGMGGSFAILQYEHRGEQ